MGKRGGSQEGGGNRGVKRGVGKRHNEIKRRDGEKGGGVKGGVRGEE